MAAGCESKSLCPGNAPKPCYRPPAMVRVLMLIAGSLLGSCAVFQPVGDFLLGNTAEPARSNSIPHTCQRINTEP